LNGNKIIKNAISRRKDYMYTLAMIFVTFVVAGVGGFLTARNIYTKQ
jgi:hypothetical protein